MTWVGRISEYDPREYEDFSLMTNEHYFYMQGSACHLPGNYGEEICLKWEWNR